MKGNYECSKKLSEHNECLVGFFYQQNRRFYHWCRRYCHRHVSVYISKPILKYEAEHTNIVSSTDVTDLKVTVREKEYKDMINRLNRIEGQVRGVKRMVEEDAYCPDILIQVSAINAALNSFNKVLLAQHIRTCVADGIRNGEDDKVDELVTMLQKLMK